MLQSLKEAYLESQVIVLASSPTPTLRRSLQGMGHDIYLSKPAPLAILIEAAPLAIETIRRHRTEDPLPDVALA